MKQTISGLKRRYLLALFSFILLTLLLLGSCSAYNSGLGYFDMLDDEKHSLRNKRAAEKFWSSVRPMSTLSESHYKLGRHYQKQGRYKQAIEEFSKALNVDARLCKAYNGIAMSYDALKECDLAHKAYELALGCDPGKAYIYNNYGYSSILCNKLEKGTALLLKAEELSTGSEQIKNNLELAQLATTRQPNADCNILPADVSDVDLAQATPRELATYLATAAEQKIEQEKVVAQKAEAAKKAAEADEVSQDAPALLEQPSVVFVPSAGANFQPHLLVDDFEPQKTEELTLPADTSVAAVNTGHAIKPVLKTTSKSAVPQPAKAMVKVETEKDKGVDIPAFEPKPEMLMLPVDPLAPAKAPEVQAKSPTLPEETEVEDKSQAFFKKTETGVEVSNGNGVTGMARRSSELLGDYGFKVRRITNARSFQFDNSIIYYRDGYLAVAEELSHFIPGDQQLEQVDSLGRSAIGVRVLLGNDMVMLDFPAHFTQLSYVQLEEGKPGVWKDLVTLTMDE
ncbi:LytR C-terminal domain-containing protein [Desulfosediminicola ganghwensis]|uniref:LytR C-terminal domain-containing protein n=1 Tax=Desulfosediminicola ganghwensis TaxID=2569540 RepID=UPI0010ABCCFC|nr:LytR C-terminal domain-containing protein [Desulfosediminicola ganghwensis]